MVDKEKLKKYAKDLMFSMDDEGYDRTLKEFETIEKHMDIIGKFDGIEKVDPQTFPYDMYIKELRSDEEKASLSVEEVLKNCKSVEANKIKVPKVV